MAGCREGTLHCKSYWSLLFYNYNLSLNGLEKFDILFFRRGIIALCSILYQESSYQVLNKFDNSNMLELTNQRKLKIIMFKMDILHYGVASTRHGKVMGSMLGRGKPDV